MLSIQSLLESDPRFSPFLPPPLADTYLQYRLGRDYEKYLEMRHDGDISSAVSKRVNELLGRDVLVLPPVPGMADDATRNGIDKARIALSQIDYDGLYHALIDTGYIVGFSVLLITEERRRVLDMDMILPRFNLVEQKRFTFAHKGKATAATPIAGDEEDPNDEYAEICGYELRLLTNRAPFTGERCPASRFLPFSFGRTARPVFGLGYGLYPYYVMKREAMLNLNLRSDRGGNPPVIARTPSKADSQTQATLDAFAKAISPRGYARLSQGYGIEVLKDLVTQLDKDASQQLIDECRININKIILGEQQLSDRNNGSRAAEETQVDARKTGLIDADCNLLDPQLSRLWDRISFLNGFQCPIVRRETKADTREAERVKLERESLKERAETDAILIERLNLVPDEQYIKETYGEQWSIRQGEDIGRPNEPGDMPEPDNAEFAEPIEVTGRSLTRNELELLVERRDLVAKAQSDWRGKAPGDWSTVLDAQPIGANS